MGNTAVPGVLAALGAVPARLRRIAGRPFARNVAIVAGGSMVAQAITLAASPVITRLYGPDAFGVLGAFLSITDILAPVAALGYSHAIALPKRDSEARSVVRLSLCSALCFSILAGIVLIGLRGPIVRAFGLESIQGYLPLVPAFVFLAAAAQVGGQWLIRCKRFMAQTRISVANALVTNGAKIGFGAWSPTAAVLVCVSGIGSLINVGLLAFGSRTAGPEDLGGKGSGRGKGETLRVAKDLWRFPAFRAPQLLLNALSRNLPVLGLSAAFGPAAAGFYALSHRVLLLPSDIVGKAVANVFMSRFAEAVNRREDLRPMVLKATVALACVGAVPFGSVALVGPALFSSVFGAGWEEAGEYARWLSILLFASFVARPCSQSLLVLQRQRFLLLWDIVFTSTTFGILVWAGGVLGGRQATIAAYSMAGAALYAVLVIKGIAAAAGPRHDGTGNANKEDGP